MLAPCINDNPFWRRNSLYYPINAQYIICTYNENYKIFKSAPTCFGSQRIHHPGVLYSAWLKNYKNDSIVSVDMDKVGVTAAFCNRVCSFWPVVRVCNSLYMTAFFIYCDTHAHTHTHTQQFRICCHNTDLVHINGHDRIILVIFSQMMDPLWSETCWSTFNVPTYYILCIGWVIKCLTHRQTVYAIYMVNFIDGSM